MGIPPPNSACLPTPTSAVTPCVGEVGCLVWGWSDPAPLACSLCPQGRGAGTQRLQRRASGCPVCCCGHWTTLAGQTLQTTTEGLPPAPPTGAHTAPGHPEHRSGALIQAEVRGGDHSPTSLSPALVRWGPPAVQLAWGSVGRRAGPRALLWGTGRVSIASTGPGLEQPRYHACQRCWKPRRPRSVRTSQNLRGITRGLAGCRCLLPDGSQVKANQVLGTHKHRLTERHPGRGCTQCSSAGSPA